MNECVARFVNCRPTALLLDIRMKETDYMKETCPPHVDVFSKYKDIEDVYKRQPLLVELLYKSIFIPLLDGRIPVCDSASTSIYHLSKK